MFLTILLLLVGINIHAQSVSTEQMDERFNNNKLPYGWFAEGWKVDSTGVAKKGSPDTGQNETGNGTPNFNMEDLMGGGSSLNYLMTPPLNVQSGEVLAFSAKKGKGGSGLGSFMGGDSDSTFVVERPRSIPVPFPCRRRCGDRLSGRISYRQGCPRHLSNVSGQEHTAHRPESL